MSLYYSNIYAAQQKGHIKIVIIIIIIIIVVIIIITIIIFPRIYSP